MANSFFSVYFQKMYPSGMHVFFCGRCCQWLNSYIWCSNRKHRVLQQNANIAHQQCFAAYLYVNILLCKWYLYLIVLFTKDIKCYVFSKHNTVYHSLTFNMYIFSKLKTALCINIMQIKKQWHNFLYCIFMYTVRLLN